MEISSMTSCFGLETRMLATTAAVASPSRNSRRRTLNVSAAKFSSGTSLTSSGSSNVSPLFGGSVTSDFSSHSILRPSPLSSSSFSSSPRIKRNVITMVIPFVREDGPTPPDLASYLFANRIIYLGMPLFPGVTELIIAEIVCLDYKSRISPMFFYINSTGSMKDGQLYYLAETFAIYDCMSLTSAPFYTLAVGNAWGEAALLLSAGAKGCRAALPSASIMLKQPYAMAQGQATAVEGLQRTTKMEKEMLVKLFAHHTGKDIEQVEKDIRRPKYLSPTEAIEYGIIDKVIHNERATKRHRVFSALKKDNPI